MTLESGPKNLEGGKIEAPRVPQEMPGAEAHDDVARDVSQETESDREKGSAVKKKIEIPGVGEIEYAEKRVMFPEKIVQETGGVKGYVRKMVSWEELAKFYGISAEEFEKIKTRRSLISSEDMLEIYHISSEKKLEECPKKESVEKFKKRDGLTMLIRALTNGEFINQTMNHILYGEEMKSPISDEFHESLTPSRILEKMNVIFEQRHPTDDFGFGRFKAVDIKTNQEIPRSELFKRAGISEYMPEKDQRWRKFSKQEAELISDKISKLKDVYLYSIYGLNLTNPSRLWRGYGNHEYCGETVYDGTGTGEATSPYLTSVVLGFKINTRNKVLREYSSKAIKIIKDIIKEIENDEEKLKLENSYLDGGLRFEYEGVRTLDAILNPKESSKTMGYISVVARVRRENEHPRIPLVINHPDIPELRWCHADYAAIPTKNGYNIIEMIT